MLGQVITIALVLQSILAASQSNLIISPEQMIKLVPSKFEGYKVVDDNKGKSLKIGTLTYSMVERSFVKNKCKITMLLFDYNNAPIMYHQATNKWANQVQLNTDTLMQQSIFINENEGWEFYHKLNNTSQLALGINKRFYMLLNGADVNLDELHELLALLSFSEFPDQNVDFTSPKTR